LVHFGAFQAAFGGDNQRITRGSWRIRHWAPSGSEVAEKEQILRLEAQLGAGDWRQPPPGFEIG
jgi:hypothetical protein